MLSFDLLVIRKKPCSSAEINKYITSLNPLNCSVYNLSLCLTELV